MNSAPRCSHALTRQAPDDDAVIAVDVGNNTYSFGRYFECKNVSPILMSGLPGLDRLRLPGGDGCLVPPPGNPAPRSPVAACFPISGDGGFGQYMGEMTTAVHYGMNLTHVLLNNGQLGKISKEQRSAELEVWQTSLSNPNFAEYATNCGALGIRVNEVSELPAALARALAHEGPSLVEVMTDAELV